MLAEVVADSVRHYCSTVWQLGGAGGIVDKIENVFRDPIRGTTSKLSTPWFTPSIAFSLLFTSVTDLSPLLASLAAQSH